MLLELEGDVDKVVVGGGTVGLDGDALECLDPDLVHLSDALVISLEHLLVVQLIKFRHSKRVKIKCFIKSPLISNYGSF